MFSLIVQTITPGSGAVVLDYRRSSVVMWRWAGAFGYALRPESTG
jgi:hypothetical protein